jgi:hypothetical protein
MADFEGLKNIGLPLWMIILLIILFTLFKDPEKFYGIFFRHRTRQLEILEKCLTQIGGDGSVTRAQLEELRDAVSFQLITGIYAKRSLREALFKFHAMTPPEVSWVAIRRGLTGATLIKGGLTFVPPKNWEVILSWGAVALLIEIWLLLGYAFLNPDLQPVGTIGEKVAFYFIGLLPCQYFTFLKKPPERSGEKCSRNNLMRLM